MENKDLQRISVIALILAIFFGILQYIPQEKTYDSFILETALKVISNTFFSLVLILFLIYIILIAINLGYDMENIVPTKFIKAFYNFSILITFFIIIFTIGFGLLINLIGIISFLTPKLASGILIIFFAFIVICFSILFQKYVF